MAVTIKRRCRLWHLAPRGLREGLACVVRRGWRHAGRAVVEEVHPEPRLGCAAADCLTLLTGLDVAQLQLIELCAYPVQPASVTLFTIFITDGRVLSLQK